MPNPHVVFLLPNIFHNPSGISTYYFNLIQILNRLQYKVSLLIAGNEKESIHQVSSSFHENQEKELKELGGQIIYVPFVSCKKEISFTFPLDSDKLIKSLKELEPDLLWCTEHSLFILKTLGNICELLKRPLVCYLHSSLENFCSKISDTTLSATLHGSLKRMLPLNLTSCTMVLTSGLDLAQNYRCAQWKARKWIATQITPIDESEFEAYYIINNNNNNNKNSSNNSSNNNSITKFANITLSSLSSVWNHYSQHYWLFVGKLEKEEGVERLPVIWKYLNKKNTKLIIVGMGSYLKWLKDNIPKNGEWLFLSQEIPRTQLVKLYQHTVGLITTHTQPSFGYMCLEAGICACPLLISIVKDKKNKNNTNIVNMKSRKENKKQEEEEEEQDQEDIDSNERQIIETSDQERKRNLLEENKNSDLTSLMQNSIAHSNSLSSLSVPNDEAVSALRSISFSAEAAYREWKTEEECAYFMDNSHTWTALPNRNALKKTITEFQIDQLKCTAQLFQHLVHVRKY